jgi:hypothetical protein
VDGVSWSLSYQSDKGLRSVICTDGVFLATGNDGIILVSSNGVAWEQRSLGLPAYYAYNLRDAFYADGLWVVVGNEGLILTSPDMNTWKIRVSHTMENLHAIRSLNDTLVTIGNRGTILQSDVLSLQLAAALAGSNLRLIFSSPYEGVFKLQESSDFNWTDLVNITNVFGTVEQLVPLSPGPVHHFYRVAPGN